MSQTTAPQRKLEFFALKHWIVQRATAIALIPLIILCLVLSLYFLCSPSSPFFFKNVPAGFFASVSSSSPAAATTGPITSPAVVFDALNGVSLVLLVQALFASSSATLAKLCFFALSLITWIHAAEGIKTIIEDYVYYEKIKMLCFFFVTGIQMQLLKYMYIFIFFGSV
uniref:Succinate dehydrogenase subunit 4 n=1 Tax=Marophrys sp. SRT127 TaxID=2488311 RepID=A0A455RFV3_9EUKA|nr:succinate dehydrogenase subunit 4 [Marophrys sp. SRT127]